MWYPLCLLRVYACISALHHCKSEVSWRGGSDEGSGVKSSPLGATDKPVPSPLLIPALSPQVVLINAVRDVAKALAELISATKCAAGKPADDPSMYQLKSAAKVKE